MSTVSQIRGALLEESLLFLLRSSGYRTVPSAGTDPTLYDGAAGLEVHGRGERHQIDAVADLSLAVPFCHPQRLLVEAKCYSDKYPVGLPIIRNAVGVLKDVDEFWVPGGGRGVPRGRYHYRFALFSASNYTREAERYAYAQNIYLIPLERSAFLKNVIKIIRSITHRDFEASSNTRIDFPVRQVREYVRSRADGPYRTARVAFPPRVLRKLERLSEALGRIGFALLAMLAKKFPVLLVPSDPSRLNTLGDDVVIRIRWDSEAWFLDSQDGQRLFSFDLPPDLFDMYAAEGELSEHRALELKTEQLSEFAATFLQEGHLRMIRFRLDHGWLDQVRRTLDSIPRAREGGPESGE